MYGDLIAADHRVLSERSPNNHRYQVEVQDSGTQWIQSHPCKTKSSHETERSRRKFLEPSERPKVIIQTILQNLANLVKMYPGIIVHQRTIDLRQMVLLREWYAELKKGLLLCCSNVAWMNSGGLILSNITTICETFKTSYQTGKHVSKKRLGEPFRGPETAFGNLEGRYFGRRQ